MSLVEELNVIIEVPEIEVTVEDIPPIDFTLEQYTDVVVVAAGNVGQQGPIGLDGPAGPVGADSIVPGPQGLQGDPGNDGADGDPGAPGPTDHGLLTGLGDDDHPQYRLVSVPITAAMVAADIATQAELDAFIALAATDAELASHVAAADPHTVYRLESVPITAAMVAADIATQAELDVIASYIEPIQDIVLGATTSLIDFTSIPATYKHLMLVLAARSDYVGLNMSTWLRFNNDSSNAYYYQLVSAQGSVAPAASDSGGAPSEASFGTVAGTTASAGMPGHTELLILDYARTVWGKYGLSRSVVQGSIFTAGGQQMLRNWGIAWNSSTAINRITIGVSAGANFLTGSRATLYGLR